MAEITAQELRRRYEAGEKDFRGLDLSEIELFGRFADADFTGANFQSVEIRRCSFEGCDLSGVDFRGIYIESLLEINRCVFTDLNLSHAFGASLIFNDGDLRNVRFRRINLFYGRATNCDLRGVDLSESSWFNADFSGSSLEGAKLTWGDFSGSNFKEVDLSRVDLSGTDLSRCNLKGADLSGANLRSAILSRADLSGACLDNVNLWGAWLDDAVLCDASLLYTKGNHAILKGANFKGAKTSPNLQFYRNHFLRGCLLWDTILPDGDLVIGPEWTRE
jgi:uncharacterized protein YjbI with pentapeptide repeats